MKTYKVIVSFGDGKPLETTIEAKNGLDAQDVGFRSHLGARQIRILGVISEDQPQVPVQELLYSHPLFGDPVPARPKSRTCFRSHAYRDNLVEEAIKLRNKGLSFTRIASQLEVGKTTVRKWMFDAKVP
jgi:hypothetical protein